MSPLSISRLAYLSKQELGEGLQFEDMLHVPVSGGEAPSPAHNAQALKEAETSMSLQGTTVDSDCRGKNAVSHQHVQMR